MNYKKLTLLEIRQVMQDPNWLDKLTDDEAFDLIQRRNELMEEPISTEAFKEFDRLNTYNVDYRTNDDNLLFKAEGNYNIDIRYNTKFDINN